MLYKMRANLLKAFKKDRNFALYSEEGRGVVPTHAGGGTLLDGKGTLVGQDETMLHSRALEILAAATHMSYADALRQARREAAAEERGSRFAETRFAEGGRIPVDQDSVRVAARAKEIMAENKWPSGRFGEALKRARSEMRNE